MCMRRERLRSFLSSKFTRQAAGCQQHIVVHAWHCEGQGRISHLRGSKSRVPRSAYEPTAKVSSSSSKRSEARGPELQARTVDLLRVALQRRRHAPCGAVEQVHLPVCAGRRHHRVARGARIDREDAGLRYMGIMSAAISILVMIRMVGTARAMLDDLWRLLTIILHTAG